MPRFLKHIYFYLQKIDRRIALVEQMDWEVGKQERVKICLTKEYRSSDESEVSEHESGVTIKKFVLGKQKVKGSQGFDRPVLDGVLTHQTTSEFSLQLLLHSFPARQDMKLNSDQQPY